MKRTVGPLGSLVGVLAVLGGATPAAAHPAPFSFVDVRVQATSIDVEVVLHVFDVAYELGLQPPDRVLDPTALGPRADRLAALLLDRLHISVDGRLEIVETWANPEPLPERQSVSLRGRVDLGRAPGVVDVAAVLFPYDPAHQTFVNFYDDGELNAQAILGGDETSHEYFVGSRQGTLAVIQKFVPQGVHHILIGPDHLLFLVGLLLLGGALRRLLMVITAFTVAHSVTLALAVLNVVTPPGNVVEPIIALSIVYVGADNLLVRTGRDMRVWIALVFGLIHGFGFASVLREMGLPSGALGWSLFSFNLGVEIGQIAVAVVVSAALMALRARSDVAGRRLAFAGSIVVMAAGTFWFVQRVFFPGGMA
ncbi:MAG: HupE/UreJ family protein [Vicinamibacterales bacterium]|nr:HupE/UreJ family protein [Vicinamibacterales bacterium]